MSEHDLFHAYRNTAGNFLTQCACDGWIEAANESAVPDAILMHNLSTEHQHWRRDQDAVEALQRKPLHPCPCGGLGRRT